MKSVPGVLSSVNIEVESSHTAAVRDRDERRDVVDRMPSGQVPLGVDVGEYERAAVMTPTVQKAPTVENA